MQLCSYEGSQKELSRPEGKQSARRCSIKWHNLTSTQNNANGDFQTIWVKRKGGKDFLLDEVKLP